MNAVRNYQKELDKIIEKIAADRENIPTLFLHSCCAPCSSYVLEYLRKYFRITVFYYNPNITEDAEYRKRVDEQKRLIAAYNEKLAGSMTMQEEKLAQRESETDETVLCEKKQGIENRGYFIDVIEGDYDPQSFLAVAKGLEQCPEGGERCFACYALRLRETASRAQTGGYDYFTTTLTISPLKNAGKLNEIGEQLSRQYGVPWLPSDFKKKNGYKRSIELSKEYDLYRQDYCGCIYSRRQRQTEMTEAGL